MNKRICIAVNSLENKRRCIGQSAYQLAVEMKKNGWDVTVFSADYFNSNLEYKEKLKLLNIETAFPYINICETAFNHCERDNSMLFHQWVQDRFEDKKIQEKDFDIIYFADDSGLGFIPIQSKRILGLYDNTVLCAFTRKYCELAATQSAADYLKLIYMRRYCAEFCDLQVNQYFTLNSDLSIFDNIKLKEQRNRKNIDLSICVYAEYDSIENSARLLDALQLSSPNIKIILAVKNEDFKEPEWASNFRIEYENIKIISGDFKNRAEAMNVASCQADSAYILFIDERMEILPDMINIFSTGLSLSECDILTAWIRIKPESGAMPFINNIIAYWGNCIEAGFVENIFGGLLFAVKKEIFEKHKFNVEKESIWEFFARTALVGASIDVIPKPLAFLEERYVDLNHEKQNVTEEYAKSVPYYCTGLFKAFGQPVTIEKVRHIEIEKIEYVEIEKEFKTPEGCTLIHEDIYIDGLYLNMIRKLNRIFPKDSKRRDILKKIAGIFIRNKKDNTKSKE